MSRSLARRAETQQAQLRLASRREQQAISDVFEAELDAWTTTEINKRWTAAVGDAVMFAADAELQSADDLMAKADGSAVKQEIAAEYIALANNLNRDRIARTFRL